MSWPTNLQMDPWTDRRIDTWTDTEKQHICKLMDKESHCLLSMGLPSICISKAFASLHANTVYLAGGKLIICTLKGFLSHSPERRLLTAPLVRVFLLTALTRYSSGGFCSSKRPPRKCCLVLTERNTFSRFQWSFVFHRWIFAHLTAFQNLEWKHTLKLKIIWLERSRQFCCPTWKWHLNFKPTYIRNTGVHQMWLLHMHLL